MGYLMNELAGLYIYAPKVKAEQVCTDMYYLNTTSIEQNKHLVREVDYPDQAMWQTPCSALLTELDEFKSYERMKVYERMKKSTFVFDGRNVTEQTTFPEGMILYTLGQHQVQ